MMQMSLNVTSPFFNTNVAAHMKKSKNNLMRETGQTNQNESE
jgi:hypothetical protein